MKFQTYTLRDGFTTVIPEPERYTDCFELIRSDRFRLDGRIHKVWPLIIKGLFFPTFYPLIWLRLASLRKGIVHQFARLMYRICRHRCHLDIPYETRIGYGLYIAHGMCIVVNSGTIIGNNVNLSQFLNIGTNHSTPARIGDSVYIGPMTCIVEDVHIGSRSTIGAGAVVTRDVPADALAVGVPARIIDNPSPTAYINHPWPC